MVEMFTIEQLYEAKKNAYVDGYAAGYAAGIKPKNEPIEFTECYDTK